MSVKSCFYKLRPWPFMGMLCVVAVFGGSIYLFPSGMPQPADFIWLIWSAACLGWAVARPPAAFSRRARLACLSAILFLAWIGTVSSLNAFVSADVEIMRHALFYVFNVAVFVAVVTMGSRDPVRFSHWVSIGAIVALVAVVIGLGVSYDASAARQTGGFNNPNQMAYFALLSCALFVITTPESELSGIRGLVMFGMALVVVGFSASLTVMTAIFVVVAAAVLKLNRIKSFMRAAGALAILLILGKTLLSMTQVGAEFSTTVASRLASLARKSEDVGITRGYSRIAEFPEFLLFGAGEGGLSRFGLHHQLEIHSSWGTLLFSYGVVGLGIFCLLLFVLLRRRPPWVWMIVSSPALYGFTHQGLRATMFWVLLGCVSWVVIKGNREACATYATIRSSGRCNDGSELEGVLSGRGDR